MQSVISEINHLWPHHFFSKCQNFDVACRNLAKNWENVSGFGHNWIWIGCVKHSLFPRANTCHRESICYQTVSIFQIILRLNFTNLSYSKAIKKYLKSTAVKISALLRAFNIFSRHKCYETKLFSHLINHVPCSI